MVKQQEREMAMVPAHPRTGIGHVLRNGPFVRLWTAQIISQTVQNAVNYALMIDVTIASNYSPLAVGFEIILFSLPAVLFGPTAGVFVDRMSKRRVLTISNLLRGLLTTAFLVFNHTLGVIYTLLFITSTISQFFAPAEASTIPLLVDEGDLLPALSLFNVTFVVAQALGFVVVAPALYNIFGSRTGAYVLYSSVSVLFVVAAALVWTLPLPGTSRAARGQIVDREAAREFRTAVVRRLRHGIRNHGFQALRRAVRPSVAIFSGVMEELREGWDFVGRDRYLRDAILQQALVSALLLMMAQLASGSFIHEVLHLPPTDTSYVLAPAGVGLIIGSVFAGRVVARLGKMGSVSVGFVSLGLGLGGMALAPIALAPALEKVTRVPVVTACTSHAPECSALLHQTVQTLAHPLEAAIFWVLFESLAFALGAAMALVNVPAQTLMQERTPQWIKGRVIALQQVAANAAPIPVLLFAGKLAETLGVIQVMFVVAAIVLLFGLWTVLRWVTARRKGEVT